MIEPNTCRYRVRPSWRLLGCALLGLIWGGKTAQLILKYYGSSIEASYGSLGWWTVGVAVAVTLTVTLGILIDWAYWSDEVVTEKAETAKLENLAE